MKSIVQQSTSVQSLINFAPTTQFRLMAFPTHLPTSPISSEGSTVLLSSYRDPSPISADPEEHIPIVPDRPGSPGHLGPTGSFPLPRSPDHEGHTPTVPDRPGSPSPLGPARSPPIVTGSPDQLPTGPLSPAQDLSSRSPDHGMYNPIVPDRSISPLVHTE